LYVADALLEAMEREGLLTVFGIPGSANLGLYEKIPDHNVNVILMRHEQGAAHAADAFGRVKRKIPGVAFATSGPGATNLVTGLTNAYMDSAPMIAITGQVPTSVMGRDAFQETDVVGVTMPITKHSFLVRDPEHVSWAIRAAKKIAITHSKSQGMGKVVDMLTNSDDYTFLYMSLKFALYTLVLKIVVIIFVSLLNLGTICK